jgi:hypothetical protein
MFLDFVDRLMFLKKHNVSETGSASVDDGQSPKTWFLQVQSPLELISTYGQFIAVLKDQISHRNIMCY